MRKGAIFINTARGGLHDEAALYAALACDHLGGAGIDVWDEEPPALDHPLLGLDNVVGLYHTAGVTREAVCAWGYGQRSKYCRCCAARRGHVWSILKCLQPIDNGCRPVIIRQPRVHRDAPWRIN